MDIISICREKTSRGQYWSDLCSLLISHHPNNGFREWNALKEPDAPDPDVSTSCLKNVRT